MKTALILTLCAFSLLLPVAAAAQDGPPAKDLRARIDALLSPAPDEPTLAELEQAALALADADPQSASGWLAAPNRAALLPVLKLSVNHDMGRNESLDRDQVDPDRYGVDADRGLSFDASAEWNLAELVFNPDEVRVYGALADRAERRQGLLTTLVGYHFERRRLIVQGAIDPGDDPVAIAERLLRIEELTAAIDALTGGLLSRTLKRKGGPGKKAR
ncbi:MAG: hypothetical protein PHU25_12665 [Deltaproteobacteria bacterium]|nr:hypothetical protein [Deltaproteobacteria bacterium]